MVIFSWSGMVNELMIFGCMFCMNNPSVVPTHNLPRLSENSTLQEWSLKYLLGEQETVSVAVSICNRKKPLFLELTAQTFWPKYVGLVCQPISRNKLKHEGNIFLFPFLKFTSSKLFFWVSNTIMLNFDTNRIRSWVVDCC